jgi:hypothetical protein
VASETIITSALESVSGLGEHRRAVGRMQTEHRCGRRKSCSGAMSQASSQGRPGLAAPSRLRHAMTAMSRKCLGLVWPRPNGKGQGMMELYRLGVELRSHRARSRPAPLHPGRSPSQGPHRRPRPPVQGPRSSLRSADRPILRFQRVAQGRPCHRVLPARRQLDQSHDSGRQPPGHGQPRGARRTARQPAAGTWTWNRCGRRSNPPNLR